MGGISWVGFDGDDTLWKSEDYYRSAEVEFENIIGQYIDLTDARTLQHLHGGAGADLGKSQRFHSFQTTRATAAKTIITF